jgi:hypothetical protein
MKLRKSANALLHVILTPPSSGDVLALNLHKPCSSAAFLKLLVNSYGAHDFQLRDPHCVLVVKICVI